MMKARYEVTVPADLQLSVELRMSITEWRRLRADLQKDQLGEPGRHLHDTIDNVLQKFAEATSSRFASTPWRTDAENPESPR